METEVERFYSCSYELTRSSIFVNGSFAQKVFRDEHAPPNLVALATVAESRRLEGPRFDSPDRQVGVTCLDNQGGPKDRNDHIGPSGLSSY